MDQIGILHHPRIPESQPLAQKISQWLVQRGVQTWVGSTWDDGEIGDMMGSLSLLVVIGGDGSTLRAARLSAPHKVPIFGVNMGRVGFLSEAQLNDWEQRLSRVLEGSYWTESRLMMLATLERQGEKLGSFVALNDVVVGRGQQARLLRLHLHVDDDHVTTYAADALIVATPTGSTAYSMAAGGPLLPPQLQNFVVVPVAPHLSLDRALVLHEQADISIRVSMDHEATVTADGQEGVAIADGDVVYVQKHHHRSYFARVESPGYFYRRLMGRLGHR